MRQASESKGKDLTPSMTSHSNHEPVEGSKGAPWHVYILELSNGKLYVGTTQDLDTRFKDHGEGRGCRTTKIWKPKRIVYSETHETKASAQARERQLKHWSRAKKLALITGETDRLKGLSRRRT